MKRITAIVIAMTIAMTMAMAEGPTGVKPTTLIETEKLPGQISLSGTTEASMYAISEINAELVKTVRWQMPDLGYYFSYSISVEQGENDETTAPIMKFLGKTPTMPENIGNATNATNVTDIAEELLYL